MIQVINIEDIVLGIVIFDESYRVVQNGYVIGTFNDRHSAMMDLALCADQDGGGNDST